MGELDSLAVELSLDVCEPDELGLLDSLDDAEDADAVALDDALLDPSTLVQAEALRTAAVAAAITAGLVTFMVYPLRFSWPSSGTVSDTT